MHETRLYETADTGAWVTRPQPLQYDVGICEIILTHEPGHIDVEAVIDRLEALRTSLHRVIRELRTEHQTHASTSDSVTAVF